MLCDIWFIPRLSLYVKAFFKPFFVQMKPEEAASALDGLPEETRNAMMTKGIINLLPKNVKTIMLPKHKKRKRSYNEEIPLQGNENKENRVGKKQQEALLPKNKDEE